MKYSTLDSLGGYVDFFLKILNTFQLKREVFSQNNASKIDYELYVYSMVVQ